MISAKSAIQVKISIILRYVCAILLLHSYIKMTGDCHQMLCSLYVWYNMFVYIYIGYIYHVYSISFVKFRWTTARCRTKAMIGPCETLVCFICIVSNIYIIYRISYNEYSGIKSSSKTQSVVKSDIAPKDTTSV